MEDELFVMLDTMLSSFCWQRRELLAATSTVKSLPVRCLFRFSPLDRASRLSRRFATIKVPFVVLQFELQRFVGERLRPQRPIPQRFVVLQLEPQHILVLRLEPQRLEGGGRGHFVLEDEPEEITELILDFTHNS
jgi:hypothetical protein